MKSIGIVGATSPVARELAHLFGKASKDILLCGRNLEELERDAEDYRIRYGINVDVLELDILNEAQLNKFHEQRNKLEGLIFLAGYLGDNDKAKTDWSEAELILQTNYAAAIACINPVAAHFAERNNGWICILSSVAGDRGRGTNYHYGSAKAGLSAYASGLRNALAAKGVHVLTVKPGFMRTPMTEGMPLNPVLTASPKKAASVIYKAIQKRRNVVYVLWMWRYIMLIIRHIPESIFKKLKL